MLSEAKHPGISTEPNAGILRMTASNSVFQHPAKVD